jgi:hypothetical protein
MQRERREPVRGESSKQTRQAAPIWQPMKDDDATRHRATLRPSGPGPALRQLSTGTPPPLRSGPPPAALRSPPIRRRPPAAFTGMGRRGWEGPVAYATMLANTKTVSDFPT